MNRSEIENKILNTLYLDWLGGQRSPLKGQLNELQGVDEKEFNLAADDLEENGYIEPYALGGVYELTPAGILETESRGLVPDNVIQQNNRARRDILRLACLARERDGLHADVSLDDAIKASNITDTVIIKNASLLGSLGLIEFVAIRSFRITRLGKEEYSSKWDKTKQKTQRISFETLSNSYTVKRTLGEGGVGIVYEVVDAESNSFALKIVSESVVSTEKLKRFTNELHFLARHQHKNLVPVLDEGFLIRDGVKVPFYVMPIYSGTLRTLINQGIPPDRVLPYFGDLLDGIEFLHLRGNFHRDIKPENVLYDVENDRLLIADLGTAHFAEDELHTLVETKPNSRLANFEYASPEQRKKPYSSSHLSDIYALGLLLNEMFTGRAPIGEGYPTVATFSAQHGYLDEIVRQAIRHSPSDRYQSVEDLKLRLKSAENNFISLQRLDKLTNTVVPLAEMTDSLTARPIRIVNKSFAEDSFIFELSERPNAEWIQGFQNIDYRNHALYHAWPQDMNVSGSVISLSCSGEAASLKQSAKAVSELAETYVNIANQKYKEKIHEMNRNEELRLIQAQRDEQNRILRQIQEETERQKIISEMHNEK
jgi:serine/threonine protein kinase